MNLSLFRVWVWWRRRAFQSRRRAAASAGSQRFRLRAFGQRPPSPALRRELGRSRRRHFFVKSKESSFPHKRKVLPFFSLSLCEKKKFGSRKRRAQDPKTREKEEKKKNQEKRHSLSHFYHTRIDNGPNFCAQRYVEGMLSCALLTSERGMRGRVVATARDFRFFFSIFFSLFFFFCSLCRGAFGCSLLRFG